ncbi:hypothetical protein OG792_00330 [Micromonospora sp. NBC_01699]|uniref:hypothetical protein n=1 Tax=Micromonospora sp. NBC_01699 TaxID=2975984 RepID=UPI002E2C6F2A|nr:hypothetical protein [Micromonospora sp. NBC_01699]
MSTHNSGTPEKAGDGGNAVPGPPDTLASPAAFVRAMRVLRQWSGFTYRQLQGRAQAVGDVLPHSTLAAVLGRGTLPREELLRAFVRACGGSDTAVEQWVAVRKSIAARTEPAEDPEPAEPAKHVEPAKYVEPPKHTELVAYAEPAEQAGPVEYAVRAELAEPADHAALAKHAEPARFATHAGPVEQSGAAKHTGHEKHTGRGKHAAPVTATETAVQANWAAEAGSAVGAGPAVVVDTAGEPVAAGDGPVGGSAAAVDGSAAIPEEPDGLGDGWPTTQSTHRPLAAATAIQERYRWTGVHRRDPAVDVPRPAGMRWLIPPIMYRTGWASRVLSGALVLVLILISTGAVVRYLRPTSGENRTPGVEDPPNALDGLAAEGIDVSVQDGMTDGTAEPAPNGSAAASVTSTSPPVSLSAAPSATGLPTPKAPAGDKDSVSQPKPKAKPYLTASVNAYCRGGGSWAYNISGTLHNSSVGSDPHGYVDHRNGTVHGYPIDGDGSASFYGSVPRSSVPGHLLTSATAGWRLEVWVNGDMKTGTRVSTSGTVSRPTGC